jgi:hypothetical protein
MCTYSLDPITLKSRLTPLVKKCQDQKSLFSPYLRFLRILDMFELHTITTRINYFGNNQCIFIFNQIFKEQPIHFREKSVHSLNA